MLALAAVAGGCFVDPDRDDEPANRRPTIDLIGVLDDTVAVGATTLVWVEASDADGDSLTYLWTATAGEFQTTAAAPAAVWRAPAAAGAETLRVTVADRRATAAAEVAIAVLEAVPQLGPLPGVVDLNLARSRSELILVNQGLGPLHWTAASDAAWLAVEPAAGTTADADTVTILVARDGLAAGQHLGRLSFVSDGGDRTVSVSVRQVAEPVYTYAVRERYPHDPTAFTQGLLYHDGDLYESTGRYGASTLRRVELTTGTVRQRRDLAANLFGEGLALWDTTLIQLTWQEQTALRWGLRSFAPTGTSSYPTQGWGLTSDGRRLVMSDGTSRLHFRDPETFASLGEVQVAGGTGEVRWLNELEWVDGEVWANVWFTDDIVRIDPGTGAVAGWIDLSGLLTAAEAQAADVLNGIAWDAELGRVLVTGKDWPWLFWIDVVPVD